MAKGKLSPRQKMINLMYLVFIAMLAMQIDREVLRSFEEIGDSLEFSSTESAKTNEAFMGVIKEKAKDDPEGYASVAAQAQEVQNQSQILFDAIEKVKGQLESKTGYKTPAPGEETNYNALQDVDAPTTLMFKGGDATSPSVTGNELVSAMDSYLGFMKEQSEDELDKDRLESFFSTGDNWLRDKFYNQPMIAAKSTLAKLQSDLRTEEGNLLRSKLTTKLMDNLEINELKPFVSGPVFVKKGDQQNATIAFGAIDNGVKGNVVVNGKSYSLSGGKVDFPLNTSSPGEKNVAGKMTYYKPPNNTPTSEPFSFKYKVVEEVQTTRPPANAVIRADKMNVVYRGLPNPLSASINGAVGNVSIQKVSGNGTLSGSNGKYVFTPGAGNEVSFRASGKTESGVAVTGDVAKFRVKNVPPATGMVRNKTSETMSASSLKAQTIQVKWPDFLFDVTGTVTQFSVKVPGLPTKVVSGNKLSGAGSILTRVKKGAAVNIFDIKYSSSNGGGQGKASPVAIQIR